MATVPQSAGNTAGFQLDPLIDDIDDVLEIRAAALRLYKAGRATMEWNSEGSEARKEFVAPVSEVLAETRRFLKLADPDTYGHVVRQSGMVRFG